MSPLPAYVESGVVMAYDRGYAAWSFDLSHWGIVGQGIDEAAALADLARQTGRTLEDLDVAERIHGDEQAFGRDQQAATDAERDATQRTLTKVRAQTIELVRHASDSVLDWDDPRRVLPSYARWRTLREMAWHITDTESRYYLPAIGAPSRPRCGDLVTELVASTAHVQAQLAAMPPDLVRCEAGETWTSVKLLRRLAWHERGELVAMHDLADRCP